MFECRVEDLALDVVGEAISRVPMQEHLAWYARVDPRNGVAADRATAKSTTKHTKVTKKVAKKVAVKRPAAKKK